MTQYTKTASRIQLKSKPIQEKRVEFVVGTVPCPPTLRPRVIQVDRQIQRHREALDDASLLPIHHMFNIPLFSGEQRFPVPEHKRQWRFMPLGEDPLWQDPSGYPMPDEVLKRLKIMEQIGFDEFDTFYIAHEVSLEQGASSSSSTLEELRPPPAPQALQNSQQFGGWANQVLRAGTLPFLGIMASLTVATAVSSGLGSLVLLDPILFGVITNKEHRSTGTTFPIGSFYYVAHWIW